MEILAFSDCHGNLPNIPNIGHDTLCIAGDICPDYTPIFSIHNRASQMEWLRKVFVPWAKDIKIKNKVAVFGNHDFVSLDSDKMDELKALLPDWHFLFDSSVTIDGVVFWGTPRIPKLMNWAWGTSDEDLKRYYDSIPVNVNVVISHSPPKGYVDADFGSEPLRDWIDFNYTDGVANCKLILCGHIHEGAGEKLISKAHSYPLKIANVALVDERYNRVRDPVDFNVSPDVKWGASDLRIKL